MVQACGTCIGATIFARGACIAGVGSRAGLTVGHAIEAMDCSKAEAGNEDNENDLMVHISLFIVIQLDQNYKQRNK